MMLLARCLLLSWCAGHAIFAPACWAQTPSTAEVITAAELAVVKQAEQARIAAIERVYGSVVAIYGNDRQGGGSGVLYHSAGYALTNHHVVAAAGDEGWAGLADGKLYRWTLLGTDPGGDVAIIRLRGRHDFPVAPLGDSETVRVGDWAMAMGNPFVLAEDQRPTVTLGIVSGTHRFQPGEGTNMLVYGNCIQVDSSINPGNSGGPLFNLRGQVIGINGRGSFEERGRVNVGLGYAISINQIRHFIPDLLATRTVQHGTLDCQFGNRAAGVVCQSVNLNAPIAQAGLELGDKLVAFEGVLIHSANQFTNLITTLPADWPCELTYERAGQRKTVLVRLTPLPYDFGKPAEENPAEKEEPEPKPPPDKNPAEPQEAEQTEPEKKAEPAPKAPPEKPPAPPPVRKSAARLALKPGEVRSVELNRESTELILREWRTGIVAQAPAGLSVREELWVEGKATAQVQYLLAADQRFAVKMIQNDRVIAATGFDGAKFWRKNAEESQPDLSFEKAMRDPLAAHAVAMALALGGATPDAWGGTELKGSDKAQGKIAYRVGVGPAEQDHLFLWLSVFNEAGQPRVSLLKTGISLHDDEPIPALDYYEWKTFQGIQWPMKKVFVKGLRETPGDELHTLSVESLIPTDTLFRWED